MIGPGEHEWWYAVGGTRRGPVSLDDLRDRIAAGEVGMQDLAWRDGMAEWADVGDVPELAAAAPPPLEPGAAPARARAVVPNYLWQAIAVTVICCMPFGIGAIYHAAKVDTALAAGDVPRAISHSDSARGWCWAAFWVGIFTGAGMSILSILN